jgi:hypothetical protein
VSLVSWWFNYSSNQGDRLSAGETVSTVQVAALIVEGDEYEEAKAEGLERMSEGGKKSGAVRGGAIEGMAPGAIPSAEATPGPTARDKLGKKHKAATHLPHACLPLGALPRSGFRVPRIADPHSLGEMRAPGFPRLTECSTKQAVKLEATAVVCAILAPH